ncbi:ABC transporter substrate-binding protein [Nocardioides salsibiostraticola]
MKHRRNHPVKQRPFSRRSVRFAAPLLAASFVLAACGSGDDGAATETPAANDWEAVLAEADGQTVNWYMYGGDDVLNTFIADEVATRMADLGVTLNQVRIDDTAEAVNKVLGEQQAGVTDDGTVDAIWINGENFATGVQADLWRCEWAGDLPNAEFVDPDSPAVTTDFGTPVNGCESPWQQANSALVYDSAELDESDVASIDSLLAWAEGNRGQFTYPAPPDFFGSMAIRSILYGLIDGPGPLVEENDLSADEFSAASATLTERLNEIAPTLWKQGRTYPQSQDELEKLYSDGEISAFFSYGPGAVAQKVADGLYPDTTREAVPESGNISNVSFVAVPDNAANQAGALVLADTLLDPEVQLALFEANGIYPAIDVARTSPELQDAFAAVQVSESVLSLEELTANAQPEIASVFIDRLEKDWIAQVLQKQ